MLKGLLDPCLLAVTARQEAYGYEIVRRLTAAGLDDVADGSIYPALARLERAELLQSRTVASESGPARKYYAPTDRGRIQLAAWQEAWRDLRDAVSQVLLGDEPCEEEST